MQSIVSVSPFRCRMWELHDRIEAHVNEENCKQEIESFARHGQLVPVLGRALRGDPDHEVELIYGARRLFVARHINKPLLVELRDMTDREAIVAMDIENRHRRDISPYERGMSYLQWLRSGHFQSQDEVARALKVSSSQVSRLLKLARLPSAIVAAFGSPLEICEAWGLDLIDALDDCQRRQPTLRRARAIAAMSTSLPAREVYRELMAASARGRKAKPKSHDEIVKDGNGAPLFRIRRQQKSVAVLLPVTTLSAKVLESIRISIASILQHASTQPADMRGRSAAAAGVVSRDSDAVAKRLDTSVISG